MKTITVRISPDGSEVTADVDGVVGSSCVEETKELIDSLGMAKKVTEKDAFFRQEQYVLREEA